MLTTSQPTSNFMTSDQFAAGMSGGGVQLSTSSDASESAEWSTVSSSRRRGPVPAGSLSRSQEPATTPNGNSSSIAFDPNRYGNPMHSSPSGQNFGTTSTRSSQWAKPKTVLVKPTLPTHDDSDEDGVDERVPAITKAPDWDSDSEDDDD